MSGIAGGRGFHGDIPVVFMIFNAQVDSCTDLLLAFHIPTKRTFVGRYASFVKLLCTLCEGPSNSFKVAPRRTIHGDSKFVVAHGDDGVLFRELRVFKLALLASWHVT